MNSTTRLQMAKMETPIEPFCTITLGIQKPNVVDFEELFQQALDELLGSLGDKCRQKVYQHIEERYGLSKAEIFARPEEFTQAMEDLFGKAASILLVALMRILHCKAPDFRYSLEEGVFSFADYLEKLRSFLAA